MRRPAPDQLVLWTILALPALVVEVQYARDTMSYGEMIHFTGDWSARLLIVTLAATPLRLMFPQARWTRWLVRRRRDIGVATFGYAAFHLAVYLLRKMDVGLIAREGAKLDLATGWAAFAIFAALAATSNDASVRLLRRAWKRLHRLVYLAAALTIAHWLLTAFDPISGLLHTGVLAALEAARVFLQRRRPSAR